MIVRFVNIGGVVDYHCFDILFRELIIPIFFLVSEEDSNRYTHLFLIEREYFGFNTLECCC